MTVPMKHPTDRDKLLEMIRYFIDRGAGDPNLGKTKLMKLLYYADFWHYRNTFGDAISFAPYKKYPLGPISPIALKLVDNLRPEYGIVLATEQRLDYVMSRYQLADRPVQRQRFRPVELETLDEVWEAWRSASTNEIVEATHAEAPWQSVDFYQTIPYEMALML